MWFGKKEQIPEHPSPKRNPISVRICDDEGRWNQLRATDSTIFGNGYLAFAINGDRVACFAPGRWAYYFVEQEKSIQPPEPK